MAPRKKAPSGRTPDSAEGAKKEAELTGVPDMRGEFSAEVRQEFVYKRVPHITLKSIAQNPDITEGMSREEIDAAIARHADVELLVDQPYVDTKKVRVSGKFTVESLSPHRLVEPDPADLDTPDAPLPAVSEMEEVASFEAMILDNLRAAGVLDVYDPTRGEVRSASTDDIAAWFVDTDYDGRQFFVRHAYFTGGNQPYESLAKALRADIDAEAWETLYSTTSRPFAKPSTGKIAVKVINHYGDEILQVYDCP